MSSYRLRFSFFRNAFVPLTNNTIYTMRHRVVQILEDAGFGEIIEFPGDMFSNVHIAPTRNEYQEEPSVLTIEYQINLPLQHGDLGALIFDLIPEFQREIRLRNDHLVLSSCVQIL